MSRSQVSKNDGIVEPVPGIPVFGTFAALSNTHPFYSLVQNDASNFPYMRSAGDAMPVLRRYVDHPQVVPESEYTVSEMAVTGAVSTVFASLAPRGRTKLSVVTAALSPNGALLVLRMLRPHPRARGRVPQVTPVSPAARAMGVPAPRAAPCLGVLDPPSEAALDLAPSGDARACRWLDDQTLVFLLGPAATLQPGSNVTMAGPAVGAQSHASRAWRVSLRVAAPAAPAPPVVIVTAPTITGPCSTIVLDARGSVDVGGMAAGVGRARRRAHSVWPLPLHILKNVSVSVSVS